MLYRLTVLIFVIAIAASVAPANAGTCMYCECGDSACFCVAWDCAASTAPPPPESASERSPGSLDKDYLSSVLNVPLPPRQARGITIDGPADVPGGMTGWTLRWVDSMGNPLGEIGFATTYEEAQKRAERFASRHHLRVINESREQ